MNKRLISICAAVLVLFTSTVACSSTGSETNNVDPSSKDGQGAGSDDPITLTVSTWTANEPGLSDWWPALVEGFEETHDNITVEVQQIAFADYITQITTQLTASSAPEIIHVPLPTTTLPAWAEAGFLADLDGFLGETDILDVWPESQGVMAWDGINYGVLLVDYGYVLFYNEKLLSEAGVDVPTTPDELRDAAKAVTDMPGDAYGYAITDDNSPNFVRDALVFVTGMEAPWVKDESWNLTDPAVVEAFDLWRLLGSEYAPEGTDIAQKRESFLTGSAAMMIEGPFYYATVEDSADAELLESLHITENPFPTQPGDVSHGLSIPASLDERTEAAAKAFIEYAASDEMMTAYSKFVTSPVARPGSADGLREREETEPIADVAAQAVPIIPPSLQNLRSEYSDFATLAADYLHQVLRGDGDTADILAEFEEALNSQGLTP